MRPHKWVHIIHMIDCISEDCWSDRQFDSLVLRRVQVQQRLRRRKGNLEGGGGIALVGCDGGAGWDDRAGGSVGRTKPSARQHIKFVPYRQYWTDDERNASV